MPDRGRAVLVSGGTAAARGALVSATLDALGVSPRGPLCLRLGPPQPGARIAVALPDAVEAALERLRAPGMLYEDRGCEALAGLASWLFRARTVGRDGLVLVIDDLDRWLDGRGRRDDPGGWFLPLLAACSQRAVSIVASARAGAASGAPAVAQHLAVLFDETLSLGGPPTVTRDPATLVAALAGRTFSLPALHDALEGWLDLPPAPEGSTRDDVLMVFSSPLAPPMLAAAEAAPTELEWPARPSPALSLRPPGEGPTEPPPLRAEDLLRAPALLADEVTLGLALRRLQRLPLDTPEAVLDTFFDTVSTLVETQDRVRDGAQRLGAPTPSLVGMGRSALVRFESQFALHREAVLGSLVSFASLQGELARLAERCGARATATVFLTGWRVDLAADLDEVLGKLGPVQVEARGRARVDDGLAALAVEDFRAASGEASRRPRRVRHVSHEAQRLTAYAHGLTEAGVSLVEGAQRARAGLSEGLRAVLGGFAGPTAVLFVADAGTGEVLDLEGARSVGDGSAFASVVPWTMGRFGG
ncbi:MAG: hypothetical protein JNK72_14665 [Myxococcales bacterium]|nr:hypothetical protein [Myxococcales bacterium]